MRLSATERSEVAHYKPLSHSFTSNGSQQQRGAEVVVAVRVGVSIGVGVGELVDVSSSVCHQPVGVERVVAIIGRSPALPSTTRLSSRSRLSRCDQRIAYCALLDQLNGAAGQSLALAQVQVAQIQLAQPDSQFHP